MKKKFNFFKEAISTAKTSGTIIPSSRFLAEKMLKHVDFNNSDLIVELGPGNGAITKHILNKIQPKTKLVCFEINEAFYQELLKIDHPQCVVLKASAENIREEIKQLGYDKADAIISSLPLSIIPNEVAQNILEESYQTLKNKAPFTQFQYSLNYYKKLKEIFKKKNVSLNFEPLNIPPAFIYNCTKN